MATESPQFNDHKLTFGAMWDQLPLVESYTQDGLDQLGQVHEYFKKRSAIEQEYAKSITKLSEQYKANLPGVQTKDSKRKKLVYTEPVTSVVKSWSTLLEQTDAMAQKHHALAQYIDSEISTTTKTGLKQLEADRKTRIQEIKNLKADLSKAFDQLAKTRKSYEQMCKIADDAQTALEKGEKSSNITKAQEDKLREDAANKARKADEADEEYQRVLAETNKKQHQHYTKDLPNAFNHFQTLEEARADLIRQIFAKLVTQQTSMIPEFTKSLAAILDSVNRIDKLADSKMFVNMNKSSKSIPADLPYESVISKFKQNKKKKVMDVEEQLESMAPDKAAKKAQMKIKELEKDIELAETKRAGIETLADAFMTQPQIAESKSLLDINNQLEEIETKIDMLKLRKYKFEMFIHQLESQHGSLLEPGTKAATGSSDPVPQMPRLYADSKVGNLAQQLRTKVLSGSKVNLSGNNESQHSLPKSESNMGANLPGGNRSGLFSAAGAAAEIRVQGLYQFQGDPNNDELPFNVGDILQVVERDESGWWLARDSQGREGFIPHNYVAELKE